MYKRARPLASAIAALLTTAMRLAIDPAARE
jgi:hypothetical protein